MDAVTYPEKKVADFIQEYLIPFRVNINDRSIHEKYQTIWTPTLAILGLKGTEVQRTIGFFEPGELIASLHLGIAKVHFMYTNFDTAMVHLHTLLEEHSRSEAVAEALYFRGVTLYKQKNDPGQLKKAYERLEADYPNSTWAKRAYPYRLL
jgi:hypothetical protein